MVSERTTMFLVPFLLILASGSLSAASIQHCNADADCPENQYCYTVTNVCAKCKANFCSLYHRKDSHWKQCHSEPSDCGSCLPGYEEEVLADGSTRSGCILSQQPTGTMAAMGYTVEGTSRTYISAIIGFPLIVILLGYLVYSKKNDTVHRASLFEETELQPMHQNDESRVLPNSSNQYAGATAPILIPEYSGKGSSQVEHMELQPMLKNDESRVITNNYYAEATAPVLPPEYSVKDPIKICLHDREINLKSENKQSCIMLETAVFRRPDYEEEQMFNVNNMQHQEEEEDDGDDSQEVENESNNEECVTIPPVADEEDNTMPSNWTPGPVQSENENTDLSAGTGTVKRPSIEMASSESGDDSTEQNTKRFCNDGCEEETEPRSSSVISTPFQSFRNFFSSLRNSNSTNNNTQSPNTNSESNNN